MKPSSMVSWSYVSGGVETNGIASDTDTVKKLFKLKGRDYEGIQETDKEDQAAKEGLEEALSRNQEPTSRTH